MKFVLFSLLLVCLLFLTSCSPSPTLNSSSDLEEEILTENLRLKEKIKDMEKEIDQLKKHQN
ncbi:hypothetical protein D0469_17255 [Peribacillus saganii]|uniref:Lipoprotein n=1 Tax=Peribacillus saganii TaxID=2303992 RepID=A0A372LJS6_9BACI|nr:hypothetical protein D0469_17255 [Peribacillus saganii]